MMLYNNVIRKKTERERERDSKVFIYKTEYTSRYAAYKIINIYAYNSEILISTC